MSNTRSFHPSAMRTGSWAPWVQWLACTLVLATILSAFADEEEEQYLSVVETIQKADALDSTGQIGKALTKYQEAQTALEAFRKAHPDWNLNVIAYRKNYLAQKIAFCSEKI